jgi:hypothetical protein
MAAQFTRRPDTVYVRTPTRCVPRRNGEWTAAGPKPDGRIRGTHRAGGRSAHPAHPAEVFVPTRFTGSTYCAAHP